MRRLLPLIVALSAAATPASAGDGNCRGAVGLCADELTSDCVARAGAALIGEAPSPAICSEQLAAFRACVAGAAECPGDAKAKAVAGGTQLVDPRLIGVWRMIVPSSTGGLARWSLEIADDGSYVFASDDPALKSAVGLFRAGDGKWSIRTNDWDDSGIYRVPNTDSVIFIGKAGAQIWSRANDER